MFARIVVRTQSNITGGPRFGTKYDLSASCSNCGSGAIPLGPRFLKLKRIPKRQIFQTLDGEILVSDDVASALRTVGTRFLAEVHDVSSGESLPFWELRSEQTLPSFSEATTGFEKERSCLNCSRDGYFEIPHVPLRLTFSNRVLNLPDMHVVSTYERFGNSKLRTPFEQSVFARPLFLVSDEIRSVMNDMHLKDVFFEDVSIA